MAKIFFIYPRFYSIKQSDYYSLMRTVQIDLSPERILEIFQ